MDAKLHRRLAVGVVGVIVGLVLAIAATSVAGQTWEYKSYRKTSIGQWDKTTAATASGRRGTASAGSRAASTTG